MEQLALKFRPRRFNDLVGQREAQVILQQMVSTGRIPTALLFEGCRGTGKTTTARIVAAAVNCASTDKPCGTCPSCIAVFDGTSLDVTEIDAASNGLIANIRELRQHVLYRHGSGPCRVIILDEAQSMSPEAFNAALKLLEEPPPNTLFLLLTTERGKIPGTVQSRCMPFTFRRLSIADITDRLAHVAQAEQYAVETDLLRLIAEESDGAMRDALVRFDKAILGGLSTAEQHRRLFGHTDYAPAILTSLITGDLNAALGHLDEALTRTADPHLIARDLLAVLRDVMVLKVGGDITATGVGLAARQSIALALETTVVWALMDVFFQVTFSKAVLVADARQRLELTLFKIAKGIGKAQPAPPVKRLTFAEMTNR